MMSDFHQDILDRCADHDACTAIYCYADSDVVDHETGQVIHPAGTMVWESHADAAIPAEVRIHPNVPAYQAGRPLAWRPATAEEAARLARGGLPS
jgi:hypothetical protein